MGRLHRSGTFRRIHTALQSLDAGGPGLRIDADSGWSVTADATKGKRILTDLDLVALARQAIRRIVGHCIKRRLLRLRRIGPIRIVGRAKVHSSRGLVCLCDSPDVMGSAGRLLVVVSEYFIDEPAVSAAAKH